MADEICFPRGGAEKFKPNKLRERLSIYKTPNPGLKKRKERLINVKVSNKKRKKVKDVKHKEAVDEEEECEIPSQQNPILMKKNYCDLMTNIPHEHFNEGQLLLGCISFVEQFRLVLSLPGCLSGSVLISNISENFTKQLKKLASEGPESMKDIVPLEKMFYIGQCLLCKILTIERNEKLRIVNIDLTIDPISVNHLVLGNAIIDGLPINVTVDSREDHGYTLITGIDDLPGFICFEDLGNTELLAGQTFSAYIKKDDSKRSLCVSEFLNINKAVRSKCTKFHMMPGTILSVKVTNVTSTAVFVKHGRSTGVLPLCRMAKNREDYIEGDSIRVTLLCYFSYFEHMEISELSNIHLGFISSNMPMKPIGSICHAHVFQVMPKRVLFTMPFGFGVSLMQHLKEDSLTEESKINHKFYSVGNSFKSRIIDYHSIDNVYKICLAESVLRKCKMKLESVEMGEVIKCKVLSKFKDGFNVLLGQTNLVKLIVGTVNFHHVCHRVKIGDKLTCRVLEVNLQDRTVNLTAIPEIVDLDEIVSSYENTGVLTKGVVEHVSPTKVYLIFFNGIKGEFDIHNGCSYQKGEVLSCRIDSSDEDNQLVQVTVIKEEKIDNIESAINSSGMEDNVSDEESETGGEHGLPQDDKVSPCDNEVEDSGNSSDENSESIESLNKKCLEITKPFDWGTGHPVPGDDTSESEAEEEAPKKKRKTKESEAKIIEVEKLLMDTSRLPQSVDDYERSVLASPNSSIVWLNYMAFHLQSGDFEKALFVGRKALKAINFAENNERFNIWVGLLNVESLFGSLESFNQVTSEALQVNDDYKIYTLVSDIHCNHGRMEAAEGIFKTMLKKFRTNVDAWIRYIRFMMKEGEYNKGRDLLNKAKDSLPAKNYKVIVSKFAAFEFEYGDKERGKTLLENMIISSPKGVESHLNVYVDLLLKYREVSHARQFLYKMTSEKLTPQRMKTVLKRLIEIESEHGTPNDVNKVKELAKQFAGDTSFKIGQSIPS